MGKRTTVEDGIIFNEGKRLKITRKSLIWQLCKVVFNLRYGGKEGKGAAETGKGIR